MQWLHVRRLCDGTTTCTAAAACRSASALAADSSAAAHIRVSSVYLGQQCFPAPSASASDAVSKGVTDTLVFEHAGVARLVLQQRNSGQRLQRHYFTQRRHVLNQRKQRTREEADGRGIVSHGVSAVP